jgi:hypothetical protein
MTQRRLKIDDMPGDTVEAPAIFYGKYLGAIERLLASDASALAIWLPSAPRSHDDWRRAAARDLARSHAPKRVNIVSGDEGVEIAATLTYLENAPGITGQYLAAHE